jgi:signal transduction histidine kinase
MKNWSMDLLKYRAFPELAAAVRQRKPVIMDRWVSAVRMILPAAHELTFSQVRDHLPTTLDTMADALEAEDPKATKDLMDKAIAHGETRFDQNFALGELMIEYGLLRPILIEESSEHLDRPLSVEEAQSVHMAVDIVSRRGVVTFVSQQKEQMQALVDAQTKYLSFLSHDLRGNLNSVLLMIEVLHRDLEAEPKFTQSLDDLQVMRRSILETVATMDRFLHAERFRKGKVQARLVPVNLKAVINDAVTQYAYQARDKDLEVRCDVPGEMQIMSDPQLIGMILQNFVSNAIKYTRKGEVSVTCARASEDGMAYRVSVSDQGPGIAQDAIDKVFHPFARGETHGESGTGLGLSIARQAAELLGAKLSVESQVGKGSTFHLDLPANPSAAT